MSALSPTELQERVNSICNDLYSKAEKISVRIVLSLLPEVRSTSTIHKYVKAWKDEVNANQQSLMDKMGFSERFSQAFTEEIGRFNTEAEKRHRDIAEQAKEQAREAIDDLERIEDRYHRQTATLEQAQKTIKQLEDSNREQEKAYGRVEQELRDQINKLQKENSTLSKSNENLRTEVAKAQLKVESNENYVSESKEQINKLSNELKVANDKAASQGATIAKLEAIGERDSNSIKELQSNINIINDNAKDYRRLMEASEKRAVDAEKHQTHLENKLNELKTSNTEKENEITSMKGQLLERENRIQQQDKVIEKFTSENYDTQ